MLSWVSTMDEDAELQPLPEALDAAAEAASDPRFADWDAFEAPDLSAIVVQLRRLQEIAKRHEVARRGRSEELPHPTDPVRGTPIGGTWGPLEVREEIGAGANGRVFRAFDPKLQREVALKLYPDQPGWSRRALEEARRLARVRHPNVLSIHGTDVDVGWAGIWTDVLSGETLEDKLHRSGPLGEAEAASIGIDLCRALHAVHRAGLVHGDIKAANVMSEEDGSIVLLDFGSGRLQDTPARAESGLQDPTQVGASGLLLRGTPLAMAPELFAGESPSPAADLYALGVLLHRLVLGRYPLVADTVDDLIALHRSGARAAIFQDGPGEVPLDRRHLPSVTAELSPEFRSALCSALHPDPAQRVRSARRMEAALSAVLVRRAGGERHSFRRASCPNNLPRQISRFIGREAESKTVRGLLDETRLVTLVGSGGAGKSRLALEVATSFLVESVDEVRFVDLASLDGAARVLPAIGEALGLLDPSGGSWSDAIEKRLRGRSLLLLLDNAEHLVTEVAQTARELLAQGEGLRILVTSREALACLGESVYAVPSLALPEPPAPGDPLSAAKTAAPYRAPARTALADRRAVESVALFLDRAEATGIALPWDEESAGQVEEICRRLDGIPLAIELAAVRVRTLPLSAIIDGLARRLRFFTTRGVAPRHQTLEASIAWSHDLLGPAERAAFRRLAVFVGGWTLEAAQAVCADRDVPADSALDHLTRLVERHLVEVDGSRSRYRLLETIHAFANTELERSGERPAALERHTHYFLALLRRAKSHLRRSEESLWTQRFRSDLDNLRAAMTRLRLQATDGPGDDPLERLTTSTSDFVQLGYAVGIWREALETGREVLGGTDPDGAAWASSGRLQPNPGRLRAPRCDLLLGVANLEMQRSEFDAASAHVEAALNIARELASEDGALLRLCSAYGYLGNLAYAQGRHTEAREFQDQALALAGRAGDAGRVAIILSNLGNILEASGDFGEARRCQEKCVETARMVGDQRSVAYALGRLGDLAAAASEFEDSTRFFEESLAIRRSIADLWGVAVCLSGLGGVSWRQGDFVRGTELLRESLEILEELGDRNSYAKIQTNLALAYYERKELPAAATALLEAIASAWEIGELRDVAIGFLVLSSVLLDQSRPEIAAVLLGACEMLDGSGEWSMPEANYTHLAEESGRCRTALGDEAETCFRTGREMTPAQAVEFAAGFGRSLGGNGTSR